MPLIAQLFAVIAAILHIWFFVLESILWRRPTTWRRFRVASQEDADTIAPMARNQGFYNLFLALGVLFGVLLAGDGWNAFLTFQIGHAAVVALFCCLCMVGAAIVLVVGDRRFLPAALIQGVPPALAIGAFLLLSPASLFD